MRFIRTGFSILELLLSVALLSILMLVMGQVLSNSTEAWKRGRSKITRFQQARQAFETLQQRLASANLATYWDYEYDPTAPTLPTRYRLRSDLTFRCGTAHSLLSPPDLGKLQGHALIFSAPLGADQEPRMERFRSVMNLCGFYVGHVKSPDLPPRAEEFGLTQQTQFGLFEFSQPMSLPALLGASTGPVVLPVTDSRLVAENVILLILLPWVINEGAADSPIIPAPDFQYDASLHEHQLPAALRVIMVAMDDDSADWITAVGKADQLIPSGLFENATSAVQISSDLRQLEAHLNHGLARRITHHIFDTTLSMQPSRWES